MATTIAPARPRRQALLAAALVAAISAPSFAGVESDDSGERRVIFALETISNLGERAEGNEAAVAAARTLAGANPDRLWVILGWFSAASPVGRNLLAGAVQSVADGADGDVVAAAAETALRKGKGFRRTGEDAFTADLPLHPEAAALAFRLLQDADPAAAMEYLRSDGLASDAPAVRRAAVAAKLEELAGDAPAADLRALLDRTLDRDQVEQIADRLAELGDPVDLPRQFGFLTDWKLAGPFDHRDDQAFDATLPPEATPDTIDPAATFPTQFPGVGETVGWREIDSDDDFGVVSVADRFENWKGSAVVLARTIESPVAGPATVRLGTPNAFKLYLNGDLLFARAEYHRGTKMDQYVIPCELAAGENLFLLKLLQNQQEQGWAQDYQIQFRVTDPTGAAIREVKAPE